LVNYWQSVGEEISAFFFLKNVLEAFFSTIFKIPVSTVVPRYIFINKSLYFFQTNSV
jgi:hypothetical protein